MRRIKNIRLENAGGVLTLTEPNGRVWMVSDVAVNGDGSVKNLPYGDLEATHRHFTPAGQTDPAWQIRKASEGKTRMTLPVATVSEADRVEGILRQLFREPAAQVPTALPIALPTAAQQRKSKEAKPSVRRYAFLTSSTRRPTVEDLRSQLEESVAIHDAVID